MRNGSEASLRVISWDTLTRVAPRQVGCEDVCGILPRRARSSYRMCGSPMKRFMLISIPLVQCRDDSVSFSFLFIFIFLFRQLIGDFGVEKG
jgi:hypothetical protein